MAGRVSSTGRAPGERADQCLRESQDAGRYKTELLGEAAPGSSPSALLLALTLSHSRCPEVLSG